MDFIFTRIRMAIKNYQEKIEPLRLIKSQLSLTKSFHLFRDMFFNKHSNSVCKRKVNFVRYGFIFDIN